MVTYATMGEGLVKQYPSTLRKKMTKGRPDLWTTGLLRSNKKRVNKRDRPSR
jgi:hypothetical protein